MDNGWPAALIALKGVAPQQRREAALRLAGHPSPQTYAALLNALGDPDPRAHEAIIRALVQQTNSDNLAHLVDVLREDHPARRNAALSTLIEIGAPKPDILTSALRHPASHVRLRIAEVLGDLCDARTTPALLDCLNNPTEAPDVRHAAAQALGKIGDPAATPALASAAEQGEFWVRYAAVEALGRIGDPKAVEPLLRLMDDVWMRPAVVTAFGEIGHLRAVEALAATLDDPNEAVRAASVEALVKIVLEPGARDIPEPEKLNEIRRLIPVAALQREVKTGAVPTSAYAAHLLGWLAQPEALPDLIATLGHADEAIRHATLEAILRYGEAAIPELLAALTDPQARVREHVAELLGMLGDSRVTPALLEHANDTEIAVRQSILRALGSVGGEAAYAGLLHALRDPATRDTALGVLGQVRGSRLIGSLKDYLQHYLYDGQPEMRGAAAEALSLFGDEVSVSILLNAIRQPDETTRRPAAEALAHIRGGRAVNALIEALGDRDWLVRQKTVEALGSIPDGRAVAALLALQHDPEWRVRKALVAALLRVGDARILEPMQALAQDPDHWVRRAVMEQCAALDDSLASEILLRGLFDADPAVRRAALVALGQRCDPSTASAVAERLTDPDPQIRLAALRALVRIDEALSGERLSLLVHDPVEPIRREVAYALGELGSEEGLGALEVLLQDEAADVRECAAESLAHIGTLRAVEVLTTALRYAPSRAPAQAQLARLGAQATRALLRTARAAEPELRATAAETLGQLRSQHAIPTLEMLLRDRDARVRQAAETALKLINV